MHEVVRAVVSGYYGYRNTGDEAILSVLLAQLRTAFPGLNVQVISGTPEETAATHRVDAILWSDPLAIANAVAQADFVITGGGGIFHDYGGFQEYGLLTEGNWGLGFHVTAGLLANLFRKPHLIYAAGVGPLFSDQAKQFTRSLCLASSLVTVRDEASAGLLQTIGVPSSHVRTTADPAFLLPPASSDRLAEILRDEGIPGHHHRITVAIRHWDQGVDPGQWQAAVAGALSRIREMHHSQIVFLPFQQFPGQQEDDVAVARRVAARMTPPGGVFVLTGNYTPAEKAALIASSRLVLGMRLHSVIFALAAERPFVPLNYDRKVEETVRRAGKAHLGLPIDALSADLLVRKMEQALAEPVADISPLRDASATTMQLVAEAVRSAKLTPLDGPILDLLQNAAWSLLRSNDELRRWLREQKINYEFQVQTGQQRVAELESASATVRAEHDAVLAAQQSLRAENAKLRQLQEDLEARKRNFQALEDRFAELDLRHRETVSDWNRYFDDLNARLAEYRTQKPWRAMLILRKGYVLYARHGIFATLRWLVALLFGKGRIETEQLDFPPRPRPRD